MREQLNFYIDGKWVAPAKAHTHDVINPANEEPVGRISLGSAEDVNKAVAAAKRAVSWGVRLISGTSTSTWPPRAIARAAAAA